MTLTRRHFLAASIGSCVAVTTPVGWYAAFHEPLDVEIVYQRVAIRGLSPRLNGLRLVQVSDLHLTRTAQVHAKMIEQVLSLRPDVVVVTGDLVDAKSSVGQLADLMSNLTAPRGVWAVPGNWDHDADAVDDLADGLKSVNIRLLVNESVQVGDALWIVGVDDPSSSKDDIEESIRTVPPGSQRLLLAHSPDIVTSLRDQNFDLILAGHTHGGQINLPLLNGTWLKSGPPRDYVEGMFRVSGSAMYVNRGIGMTHLPVRIGARPEITHFTLDAV